MIDVTKDTGGGYHVDLTSGEIESLLWVISIYLNDKDSNERDGYYEEVKQLYDKVKSAT